MKITFDASGLSKEVQQAAERSTRFRRLVFNSIRAASFTAERFIKIRMPVDTGRARASWGHSTAPAAPGDGIWIEQFDKLSITQGSRVEYIERLNEGWSRQAPAGFIDVEVTRAGDQLVADIEDIAANTL